MLLIGAVKNTAPLHNPLKNIQISNKYVLFVNQINLEIRRKILHFE